MYKDVVLNSFVELLICTVLAVVFSEIVFVGVLVVAIPVVFDIVVAVFVVVCVVYKVVVLNIVVDLLGGRVVAVAVSVIVLVGVLVKVTPVVSALVGVVVVEACVLYNDVLLNPVVDLLDGTDVEIIVS